MNTIRATATTALAISLLLGCGGKEATVAETGTSSPSPGFSLTSSAFHDGAAIPVDHTGDGRNLSPPLAWSGAPAGTRCFALIVDDPDAPGGVWTHWVIYGIGAEVQNLPGGVVPSSTPQSGERQAKNDFGDRGYGGPAPPPGAPHHYVFTLYALDFLPDLSVSAGRKELVDAMEGHILASARLIGTYGR